MKKIVLIFALVALSSCASKLNFPVSNITPGADISVKIKKDNNGNSEINLSSRYLTSPDRLTPPRTVYLVWLQTEANGLINLGQLETDSSTKASFRTVTAYISL